MSLSLKDIGKKIATNPFINPLGAIITQNKTQKELDAIKNAQANQTNYDPGQYGSPAPAPSASKGINGWVIGGLIASAALIGTVVVVIVRKINKSKTT